MVPVHILSASTQQARMWRIVQEQGPILVNAKNSWHNRHFQECHIFLNGINSIILITKIVLRRYI